MKAKAASSARNVQRQAMSLVVTCRLGLCSHVPPSDPDGTWSHVGVRNVIEQLSSALIDRHIRRGLLNNSGVVSRALDDGGAQERDLAAQYKSQSELVGAKRPRTAAILRRLSENYKTDVSDVDPDAELNELRWN